MGGKEIFPLWGATGGILCGGCLAIAAKRVFSRPIIVLGIAKATPEKKEKQTEHYL
jgi:hypothetical protein